MTKNKGVALILTVIILTAVLAIALTAGKVFTDKIKMSRSSSDSMKAYYAAESGIEYALYQIKQNPTWVPTQNCSDPNQWTTVDGASYCLEKAGDSIKAIGKAGEARRGIEVALAATTGPSLLLYFKDTTGDDIADTGLQTLIGKHIVAIGCKRPEANQIIYYNPGTILGGGYSLMFSSVFRVNALTTGNDELVCDTFAGLAGDEAWIWGY